MHELDGPCVSALDALASTVTDAYLTSKIDRLVTASHNGYPLECQNVQNQLISDLLRPGQAALGSTMVATLAGDWGELFLDSAAFERFVTDNLE